MYLSDRSVTGDVIAQHGCSSVALGNYLGLGLRADALIHEAHFETVVLFGGSVAQLQPRINGTMKKI